MEPWYKVVTARQEVRDGRSFNVRIMPYDPSAPFHERYVKNPPQYDPKLIERVTNDCRTICRASSSFLATANAGACPPPRDS